MIVRFLIVGLCVISGGTTIASGEEQPTIGMPRALEIWIPGPILSSVGGDDRKVPVVVRIDRSKAERSGFRYWLVYTGYEAGRFDLRNYLRHADGSPLKSIPPIDIEIKAIAPKNSIQIAELAESPAVQLGGYRRAVIAGGILWLTGLILLLALRPRKKQASEVATEPPQTLEERMSYLVNAALEGNATPAEEAELERTFLSYWVRRLGLKEQDPATLIAQLREHPEAGVWVKQLENWLHRPHQSNRQAPVDLLQSYRSRFEAAKEVRVS